MRFVRVVVVLCFYVIGNSGNCAWTECIESLDFGARVRTNAFLSFFFSFSLSLEIDSIGSDWKEVLEGSSWMKLAQQWMRKFLLICLNFIRRQTGLVICLITICFAKDILLSRNEDCVLMLKHLWWGWSRLCTFVEALLTSVTVTYELLHG